MCNRILQMTLVSQLIGTYQNTVVRVKAPTLHCITSSTPDIVAVYIAPKRADLLAHEPDYWA